jgi:hypothetical protein
MALGVGEFGLWLPFFSHVENPTMTAQDMETNLCRAWCEITAELLRDGKSLRQSLENENMWNIDGRNKDALTIFPLNFSNHSINNVSRQRRWVNGYGKY